MKNKRFFPVAALALLLAALPVSCRKDLSDAPNPHNPPVIPLPSAGFGLAVADRERGRDPDSVYVFEGVWRDGHFRFGPEKRDTMQLNITADNGLMLTVLSDDPDFAGVNAASSARCIDIVPDDPGHRRFHLERVCEGQAVITLWNGEGDTRREIRFTATSRSEIPVEGILVRIDGQEYRMYGGATEASDFSGLRLGKAPSAWEPWLQELVQPFPGRREDDWTDHVRLEVVGCIPLNATPTLLTTAVDHVGIIDEYAHRSSTPTLIDPATGAVNHRWMRLCDFYRQNLAHNPDFRWFAPMHLTPEIYEDYAGASDLGVWYANDDRYRLHPTAPDDRYRYWPADLRERQALVWCPPGMRSVGLGFAVGGFSARLLERPEGETDWYLSSYPQLYQIFIEFPDPLPKPLDEKWPPAL